MPRVRAGNDQGAPGTIPALPPRAMEAALRFQATSRALNDARLDVNPRHITYRDVDRGRDVTVEAYVVALDAMDAHLYLVPTGKRVRVAVAHVQSVQEGSR